MQTRSAKRVRKEALTDSSPKKLLRSAYDARRKGLVASDRYTMQKSSAKRVRDQDQAECSNRPKFADREEIVPTAPSSEKKQKASERVKPAARSCKRPCSQSQAAGDTKAVLQKATSALQKVSARCCLLSNLAQSMHVRALSFAFEKNCSCMLDDPATQWQLLCTHNFKHLNAAAHLVRKAASLFLHVKAPQLYLIS